MRVHNLEERDGKRAADLGMTSLEYVLWRTDLRKAYAAALTVPRPRIGTVRAWMVPGSDQTTPVVDEAAE